MWNSRRTDRKQKYFKPIDFMSRKPARKAPQKPKGNGLDVIARLDAYQQIRFGRPPQKTS